MSRPLSQVFMVNEPIGGASTISISSAVLYFSSVSKAHGIDLQIREVSNGTPTLCVVKNSRVTIHANDVYSNGSLVLQSSTNGTAPTVFKFSTPVTLQSQQQYALCILPHGGDPNYSCFAGTIGQKDVVSGLPIQFNQSVGPLFYYTNDINQNSSTTQAIKFILLNATCTNLRHHDDNYSYNEEHIIVNNLTTSFVIGERVYMTETDISLCYASIADLTGSFTNGELFYQSNGTANVCSGVVYFANSSTLLLEEVIGVPNVSYNFVGANSSAYASVLSVNTQVICSATSNTVILPFTGNGSSSLFHVYQSVCVESNNESQNETCIITDIKSDQKTLQLSYTPGFSDSYCSFYTIRGDSLALYANWQGYDGIKFNSFTTLLSDSTADTTVDPDFHFGNSLGTHLFGVTSLAKCDCYGTIDIDYHCRTPQWSFDNAIENSHELYWGGHYKNFYWTSTYPISWRYSQDRGKRYSYWRYGEWTYQKDYDFNYKYLGSLLGDNDDIIWDNYYNTAISWDVHNEIENPYLDYTRSWMSRSNEWLHHGGTRSVWVRHRCVMANNIVVPNIDPAPSYTTLTVNLLYADEQTHGYQCAYSNNNGVFVPGDQVIQVNDSNTAFGTIFKMDSNYIYIYQTAGSFVPGYTMYNANTPTINAYALSSITINEMYSSNVFIDQSRYISQSVQLTTGQNSEDLKVYMSTYRPSNSNFKVYAKIISAHDPNLYANRLWSRLIESNATSSLFSSLTNSNDYVELLWDFPTSQLVFANTDGCSCNTTSNLVYVSTSASFNNDDWIYLLDPGVGAFNVRQIYEVTNNTVLTLYNQPSIANSANINIGIITGIEDQTGAFLFDQNSNIVRYSTSNDVYFDTYDQFAIKIVPISDNPCIVPVGNNLRVISLLQ